MTCIFQALWSLKFQITWHDMFHLIQAAAKVLGESRRWDSIHWRTSRRNAAVRFGTAPSGTQGARLCGKPIAMEIGSLKFA